MRLNRVFIIVLIGFSFFVNGQNPQRVAYIDMNYILENVPEYQSAQVQVDTKVQQWQEKLDALSSEIEQLRTDLSNEKSLLTAELINEREEDIEIKEQEYRRLQQAYFGPKGDLFQLRKQLAEPVQDQVYNAIQDIAKNKRYDFVLDKSSDLILLYSNSKYDISELVLNAIVKDRKRQAIQDRKNERMQQVQGTETLPPTVLEEGDEPEAAAEATEGQAVEAQEGEVEKTPEQIKLEERIRKREELKERIKAQQEARARMRDSLKKVAEEKRAAQLKEIEDRKKKREQEINNDN